MKFYKKTLVLTLVLSVLIQTLSVQTVHAISGDYNDENVITNASQRSTGTITFYINVPAGKNVTYEVYPDMDYGSMAENITGGKYNSSSETRVYSITVSVKHLGPYKIRASHTYGYVWDEEIVISKFSGTKYSDLTTWDDAKIQQYYNNQKITIAFNGIAGVAMCFQAVPVGVAYTVAMVGSSLLTMPEVATSKNIQEVPIANWSWKVKCVSSGSGYSSYLLVYDQYGNLNDTIYIGYKSFSVFS